MSEKSYGPKASRRFWSSEDKWRIVEEAQVPGNSVAEVARRRGINSNLLLRWIRAAEAGEHGDRPASLVLLPEPSADQEFIPIGVFGRCDDEGPAITMPVASTAVVHAAESSARPKSVLPARVRHWTSALASSNSILPMRPMFGFKSETTARMILSDIEMIHMMRKRQAWYAFNPNPSLAEQFAVLAA
ncbi:hypothetical protein FHS21_003117 [Phyllobacterium trifolii]|uniref:Transposase n=1 Tax=Phyllobacterium trifolii TaxID=300193 RepID=A0A839UDE7_9HYPH|nr:hypothetical protein [Phyllobacterium trifolii]